MRRIIALESAGGYAGRPVLSLEEEELMVDEAQQDAAGAAADLDEAERVLEVSDALEDLAVVADQIEEATPVEAALIDNSAQMAVAGTDIVPEEIVPAMENYVGRRIATEGIRETARNIWNSILKFLKGIWEKIENFFYKIFGDIPRLKKNIADMKKRVEDTNGKVIENKTFEMSSSVEAFCINGKAVGNISDLNAGLKDTIKAAQWVYGDYVKGITGMSEKIANAIGDFDAAKPEASAEAVVDAIAAGSKGAAAPGSHALRKEGGFDMKAGTDLLGNVALVGRFHSENTGSQGVLGTLDHMRRSGITLENPADKKKDVPASFKFNTPDLGAIERLLGEAEGLLKVLEDFHRGAKSKDLKKAKDDLEKASNKATASVAKLENSSEDSDKAAVPYYRAVVNFNTAYARWAQSPAIPMMQRSLTTVRAILAISAKSLSQYKNK